MGFFSNLLKKRSANNILFILTTQYCIIKNRNSDYTQHEILQELFLFFIKMGGESSFSNKQRITTYYLTLKFKDIPFPESVRALGIYIIMKWNQANYTEELGKEYLDIMSKWKCTEMNKEYVKSILEISLDKIKEYVNNEDYESAVFLIELAKEEYPNENKLDEALKEVKNKTSSSVLFPKNNIERAKNYQKKLYSALGLDWNEDKFHNYWEGGLLGEQWDYLYDKGLVETDFCIWCGSTEISTGHTQRPMWATRKVRCPICDECFNKEYGN